jgi:hypothetical protein
MGSGSSALDGPPLAIGMHPNESVVPRIKAYDSQLMRRLMTLVMVFAVLGALAGCGSPKPA